MKGVGRSVNNALKARSYAAVTQQASQPTGPAPPRTTPPPRSEVQVTKLSNGVLVTTLENYSPVSRISFCYNAGSKYENGPSIGATHALRNAAGNLSTKNVSAFGLVKKIQQMGASLSCTTSREHMMYTIECLRQHADDSFFYLGEMATQPTFKPWEVEALQAVHREDLAQLNHHPEIQVLEGLHKAAYRNQGLGNSIYMTPDRVGSHTPQILETFSSQHLQPLNLSVVGVGISHDQLLHTIKKLDLGVNTAASTLLPSLFKGGEVRIDTPSKQVHVAMVNEGLKLGSNDLAAAGVLQRLMGTGPLIKFSTNATSSRIGQSLLNVTKHPVAASCLNISYSESGLFGFQAVADCSEVAPVLKAIVKAFSDVTKGNIADGDIQAAKSQLKAAVLMEYEDQESMIEDMDVQAMISGKVSDSADMINSVDKVTGDCLAKLAKKLLNNKAAMAAVGDLSCTPYMDECLN